MNFHSLKCQSYFALRDKNTHRNVFNNILRSQHLNINRRKMIYVLLRDAVVGDYDIQFERACKCGKSSFMKFAVIKQTDLLDGCLHDCPFDFALLGREDH